MTGDELVSHGAPVGRWSGDPATDATPIAHSADEVARLAHGARTIQGPDGLDARVSVCRACPRLVDWRELVAREGRRSFEGQEYWGRAVPGWGDEEARVVILGLAPAAHGANRTGRMFTGDRSGDWLFAALHRTGFAALPTSTDLGDGQRLVGARLVSPVRCAPPENKPNPAERDACAPWLSRELELLAPTTRVVLALGGFAWRTALTALAERGHQMPVPRPVFRHGAVVALPTGSDEDAGAVTEQVWLVGMYHPSQHNTFTGRLTEAMTDEVLQRTRELAGLDSAPVR